MNTVSDCGFDACWKKKRRSKCRVTLPLFAEQNHMLAVDHVSTSKGKALAGATGAKPLR